MKIIKTHTGKIYVDTGKKLEFLTVGDYGKENNIKAEFLGLNKEGIALLYDELCKYLNKDKVDDENLENADAPRPRRPRKMSEDGDDKPRRPRKSAVKKN